MYLKSSVDKPETLNDCYRGIIFFLFLLFFTLPLSGQNCNLFDNGVKVIINEIGNYRGQNISGSNPIEYIELLVLSNPNNPNLNVDLRGYIIDDNNYPEPNMGSESGHIKLGNCFSSIAPGTLILIYNQRNPHSQIDRLQDGMPNSNGVYQIPFNSNCLGKFGNPTKTNNTYLAATVAQNDNDWKKYIPLRNDGDLVQLRNNNAEIIHQISWSNSDLYNELGISFNKESFENGIHFELSNQNIDNSNISFSGNSFFDYNSYLTTIAPTPGSHNSQFNESYIESVKNGVLDLSEYKLTVNQGFLLSDCSSNPFIILESKTYPQTLYIQEGSSLVYTTDIYDSTPNFLDGFSFSEGTYTLSVNIGGSELNCDLEGELVIPTISETVITSCEGDCQMIDVLPSPNISNSVNCGFTFLDNEIIETSGDQVEVCTENEQQELKQEYKDGNGNTIEVLVTKIEPLNGEINIEPENHHLCSGETITITCIGQNIMSYLWSTDETTNSITVSETGDYSVTVTTLEGCEIVRTSKITNDIHQSLISSGYVALEYDNVIVNSNYENQSPYLIEKGLISVDFEGQNLDINSESEFFFSDLNSDLDGLLARITVLKDCSDIGLVALSNSSSINKSITNNWSEFDIVSPKEIDPSNNNLYFRRVLNYTSNSFETLYVINESSSFSDQIAVSNIKHFTDKAGLDINVTTTLPTPFILGPFEAVVMIGKTVPHAGQIYLSSDAIPRDQDFTLSATEWINGAWYNPTLADRTFDPFIPIFIAPFNRANELWNNNKNQNMLDGNIPRFVGFIALHGMGHCSKIRHCTGFCSLPYHQGYGFMSAGDEIDNYLNPKLLYDEKANWTFERLIDVTWERWPKQILRIYKRFGNFE